MASTQLEEIKKLLAERAGKETIDETVQLKDLGMDSLDVVEYCLELEDKYNIQFTPEELSEFKTAGDLFSAMEKKLAK